MQTHFLKVAQSFSIGGQIATPGQVVEVDHFEALDLLNRGFAVPATEDDGVVTGDGSGVILDPIPEPASEPQAEAAPEPAEAGKK